MLKLFIASLIIGMGLSPSCADNIDVNANIHDTDSSLCMKEGIIPQHMVIQAKVIAKDDSNIYLDTLDGNGWIVDNTGQNLEVDNSVKFVTYNTHLTNYIYDDTIISIL